MSESCKKSCVKKSKSASKRSRCADPDQGQTAIRLLARRAGVDNRIGGLVYEEVRGRLNAFLAPIVKSAVGNANACKKKRVQVKHVEPCLNVSMFSEVINGLKCKPEDPISRKNSKKAAMKDVTKAQRRTCLAMSKIKFERQVKNLIRDHHSDMSISSNALLLLQHASEHYIICLLRDANLVTKSAKRTQLSHADINTARLINSHTASHVSAPLVSDLAKFDVYIHRVVKKTLPEAVGMSKDFASQLSFILNAVCNNVAMKCRELCSMQKSKTISSSCVGSSVRNVLPGELLHHAIKEGAKAVTKFESCASKSKTKVSRGEKAGLLFSVSRVEKILRSQACNLRVSSKAEVFLTAVIEYLCTEFVEISQKQLEGLKKKRMNARSLFNAQASDDELGALMKRVNVTVLGGGVAKESL